MKKPKIMTSLQGLTEDQIETIACWLDLHPLREVSNLIFSKFDHIVSVTSLHRFYHRLQAGDRLHQRPDLAEDARAWTQGAAAGEADFSGAALLALQTQAFELAAAANPADTATLKTIFTILQRHRQNDLQERAVALRERRYEDSRPKPKPEMTDQERRRTMWKILGWSEATIADTEAQIARDKLAGVHVSLHLPDPVPEAAQGTCVDPGSPVADSRL